MTLSASASLQKSSGSGHPEFERLGLGEMATARVASVFLDLSKFTWRSFWDDPREVAELADAVMGGFNYVVTSLGGHVLGLRGDGMYAGFGPHDHPAKSISLAGIAAGAALDAVRNELNPRLADRMIRPVIARAGIDFGELTFVRSGSEDSSEVNVIGFTANYAAKCEKKASAWEVVVGESFANLADPSLVSKLGSDSFTLDGETRYYSYYDLAWGKLLPELDGVLRDIRDGVRGVEDFKVIGDSR